MAGQDVAIVAFAQTSSYRVYEDSELAEEDEGRGTTDEDATEPGGDLPVDPS